METSNEPPISNSKIINHALKTKDRCAAHSFKPMNRLQDLVVEISSFPFIPDIPHRDHQDSRHQSSSKIQKPPFYL